MFGKRFAEFTEFISPDGIIYPIDSGDRFIISEEGEGMPPIEYITQQGPFQHGATVIDYRLGTRIIQLILRQDACNRFDYWLNRFDLLDSLRPNREADGNFLPGTLRKKFADGSIRDINVVIQNGPTFVPSSPDYYDMFGYTETLQFVAHDPTFFDPTQRSLLWDSLVDASVLTDLVFPITFPITLGASAFSATKYIDYPGTWLSYPKITITGPQDGFKITNLSTGEYIQLSYNIASGEIVVIDLPYGNKTVVNNYGVDLQGVVTTDSDLTTFHIETRPQAPLGINTFKIESTNTSALSRVLLEYYIRYIGI